MRKRRPGHQSRVSLAVAGFRYFRANEQPNSLFALDGRYIGGTGRLESASATTPARPVATSIHRRRSHYPSKGLAPRAKLRQQQWPACGLVMAAIRAVADAESQFAAHADDDVPHGFRPEKSLPAARQGHCSLSPVSRSGVATVVALGAITGGLKSSSGEFVHAGGADPMVAQEGASDLSFSAVPEADVAAIAARPDVKRWAYARGRRGRLEPVLPAVRVRPEALSEEPLDLALGRTLARGSLTEAMLGTSGTRPPSGGWLEGRARSTFESSCTGLGTGG